MNIIEFAELSFTIRTLRVTLGTTHYRCCYSTVCDIASAEGSTRIASVIVQQ